VCCIVVSTIVIIPPVKADDPILTLTYGDEYKYYTLDELLVLDSITGNGGRLKATGEVIPPNEYTGVLITTLAQEFPDMSSRYNITSISDDGYLMNYTYNETHGEVMVYDLDGNPVGVGGVYMILATKENGQTNYSGSLRIAFINDDEPITDSFLWSKYVIELVFSPPPNTPDTPAGETNGNVGKKYTYSTSTIEPYENQVYYLWDWGDGTTSKWLGPYDSGATCEASHIWVKKNTYSIKVKAKNIHDTESDWSDSLPITIPCSYNSPMPQFFERLFQLFPHVFPILRHLLGY
jgi:hypothetical protein